MTPADRIAILNEIIDWSARRVELIRHYLKNHVQQAGL